MGLLDLFLQPKPPAGRDLLLTNEDYCLSRLRHAIWGDWFYSYEIKTSPWPSGIFKNREKNRIYCHADLKKCDCNDQREEDGSKIVPCHHIYRIALESGRFREVVNNPKIEDIICNMRDPLYNAFLSRIIERGYYSQPGKWSGSIKTFGELQGLGILQGTQDRYELTPFFKDNAAAFVYYSMTDPRRYDGRELHAGEYNPKVRKLEF